MSDPNTIVFPASSPELETFGFKFSDGGAHISRTMMLAELDTLLNAVPVTATAADLRDAVLDQNALGKTTVSTRQKSLRHLRELYALDLNVPIFVTLRRLHARDRDSLPLLALLVAWTRDPLLRSTTSAVEGVREGVHVPSGELARAIHHVFGDQYSELNRNKVSRNAASSWTQSGHLAGRTKKVRRLINPSPIAVTLALFLGDLSGHHGSAVFENPWCRLLDLDADRARSIAQAAHRAGLLNLRAVGDVVDLTFPLLNDLHPPTS